jgi:aromatic-L-amino-acid decarboxylase
MAARIREHFRLTNLLAKWIKEDKRFALSAPVVMPVACFRFIGADQDNSEGLREQRIDTLNSEIVERINASGRAYLTQTKLHGRTVMRIGLGNVLTTEQHLRNVWQLIQETADETHHL